MPDAPQQLSPALTADEWAAPYDFAPNSAGEVGDEMICVTPTGERLTIKNRHANAAIALHGRPFGFTAADVATLRAAEAWMYYRMNDGRCPACKAEENGWKMLYPPFCTACGVPMPLDPDDGALTSIADRIAALLPPEGP